MPVWKYKKKKIFPIDNLPPRGYWMMRHSHLLATNRMMMQRHGIRLPNWPDSIPVKLTLTYSDEKDFAEHGQLEKEYKCTVCHEVETYVFKIRRMGEKRVTKIQDVIVKEVPDGN